MTTRDISIVASGTFGMPCLGLAVRCFWTPQHGHRPVDQFRDIVHQLFNQPYAWLGWLLVMFVGAVTGATAAFALTRLQDRPRAQISIAVAVFVTGLLLGGSLYALRSSAAGIESPLILFGFLLLFWHNSSRVAAHIA